MNSLRTDLLYALAAEVPAVGEVFSPAKALRGMLEGRSTYRRGAAVDRALLLAATYARLLDHLNTDYGACPEPGRKRFDTALKQHASQILPEQLVFAAAPSIPLTPAVGTVSFIWSLPAEFVEDLVRYAPPVVASLEDEGRVFTPLGNVMSAVLAMRRLPGKPTWVRQLQKSTGPRWSILNLVTLGRATLNPIVDSNRGRIADVAPSLSVGQLLMGSSRATVARGRNRQRTLKGEGL